MFPNGRPASGRGKAGAGHPACIAAEADKMFACSTDNYISNKHGGENKTVNVAGRAN